MITKLRTAALALAATSLVVTPLQANVGDSMDRFMNDMGGAANVTGPSAFQGQSAGYYSLGNVWTRFPPKRSEEHTSELQSLMRISSAVFCLKTKIHHIHQHTHQYIHT